jgi:hypothetical protein
MAEARSFRLNQVPNGAQFGCALCHQSEQGGGPRNGFGGQVENTLDDPKESADVKWDAIYDQDGDADGYSNGFELGDPDGTWTIGDPNPDGEIYGPHDRDDSPCGDGVVLNPPEECDGDDLNGMTCEDLGWGPGELSCNSACRFNESECEGYVRPNNSTGNNQTTNGATNQAGATNGAATNGAATNSSSTNSGPSSVVEEEPTGCCATVSARESAGPWAALLLAVLVGLRRRLRPDRRDL